MVYLTARDMYIPQNVSQPELDAYTHLNAWIKHLEIRRGRALNDTDLVFPLVSKANIEVSTSANFYTWKVIFAPIFKASGFSRGKLDAQLSSHGFRRGAAQYYFMHAPVCLSLKAIKWWGGWSDSERVNQIVSHSQLHSSKLIIF